MEASRQDVLQNEQSRTVQRTYIEQEKSNASAISIEESNNSKMRELDNRDLIDETKSEIYKNNLDNLMAMRQLENQQDQQRNELDSAIYHQEDQHKLVREATRDFVDSMGSQKSIQDIATTELNKGLDINQRQVANETQGAAYIAGDNALDQLKQVQRTQEKLLDHVDNSSFAPNYLKDEKGVCFPFLS